MAGLMGIGSLIATLYLVPRIRGVLNYKKFRDSPNKRSSHSKQTPNLGGIAFFTVLMIAFFFIHPYDDYNEIISFIPGLTILFIAGMKDDLVILSSGSKLLAQIAAAGFMVFHYKFSIDSLHGFMGIEGLPAWLGGIFGVLIIISVINAFNLIDGIDGLASTIGIIILTGYALIFYSTGKNMLMLTSVVMTGILVGFLPYNLTKRKKIFMGDTGSMILGFMLGSMAVRMMSFGVSSMQKLPFTFENLPWLLLILLIVPLFDTARVFFIRIFNRRSPFKPDRNHIHHVLIDSYGFSHRRTSFFIGLVNFILLAGFILIAMYASQIVLISGFITVILAAGIFFYLLKKRSRFKKDN
jgi:UDP-N-acetylmuramyl pentapeptide phosphotransferase/UDP-N-acetylglucosamine-1-phosphate transferase